MGRFSKLLALNIIFDWQDSYIYYNSIKRKLRRHRNPSTLQSDIFKVLNSELSRCESLFNTQILVFKESISQVNSITPKELNTLMMQYLNLLSFSYWNLRIILQCLMRLNEIIPDSQRVFLDSHQFSISSLQNLEGFAHCLGVFTREIEGFTQPADEENDDSPLQSPLLSGISDNYQETLLRNSLAKAKDEFARHEILELFQRSPDYPDLMTLILTVFSSFIHLTNFYILGLAAKDYSVYVGMSESFSGVLSSVNWAAAVIFTFIYSYWSNYQFKIPTLVCALFVVLGNFIYFWAYPYQSAWMLVIGRILIGIGGARVINRRYISTYVSLKERTAWNSAYVAGSIIGRGVGPIAAAGLYFVNYNFFGISINGLNFPALIMGIIWLIYFILASLYFKEPEIKVLTEAHIEKSKEQSMIPTYVTILALVIPKIVHEAYVTSIPIFAEDEFDWGIEFIGVYIAAVSLAVAPVHIFIAFTSKIFQDRQFIRVALILTFFGCFFLIDFDDISEFQYIFGTILMYIGMNLDDGVATSLLSKVLPPHLTVGIFNPGLIVTFGGSFARGIGGFTIAVAGWIEDDGDDIENIIFLPMALISLIVICIFCIFYKRLHPKKITIS